MFVVQPTGRSARAGGVGSRLSREGRAEVMESIVTTTGVVSSGPRVDSAQGFTLPKRPRAPFTHPARDVASRLCGLWTS